jgi:hypothetical protein
MAFNGQENGGQLADGCDGQKVLVVTEVILVELVDIEEYAKRGEKPPKAKKYRIRVGKQHFMVALPEMTGRQILELAGRVPAESFKLQQKFKGGKVEVVGLDQLVDFTAHGVERFQWMPCNETEG